MQIIFFPNASILFQLQDYHYQELYNYHHPSSAIYTHSYDESGTKIFTAGGPLAAGIQGNYAAVWQ